MTENITIHQQHCNNCFVIRKCVSPSYGGIRCNIVTCKLGCGAQFHECKLDEHLDLCPKEKVPCINKTNGCPAVIFRELRSKHLKTCPANVVVCRIGWNRWPLLNTTHAVPTEGVISYAEGSFRCQPDAGLAVRDQFTFENWLENLKKSSPEYESVDPVKFVIDGEVSDIFSGKFSSETVYTEYASSTSSLSSFKNERAPYGAVNKVMHHFACGQIFRRADYIWHSKNVHNDIHGSVNGWIEHRCPLAYQGCKYSLRRLYPNCKTSYIVQDACGNFGLRSDSESKTQAVNLSGHEGKSSIDVTHSLEEKASFESMHFLTARANTLSSLSLSIESTYSGEGKPNTELTHPVEGKTSSESIHSSEGKSSIQSIHSVEGKQSTDSTSTLEEIRNTDSLHSLQSTESTGSLEGKASILSACPIELLDLPCEILRQIVSYVEPFSFRNVAATCKQLRSVCYSLIREKGIVVTDWKKSESGNKVHWEMQPKRWLIPAAFCPIYRWGLDETNGAMSEHLKNCPYNERKELPSERVKVIW